MKTKESKAKQSKEKCVKSDIDYAMDKCVRIFLSGFLQPYKFYFSIIACILKADVAE